MSPLYTGGCECGYIRYRISADAIVCYVCHCTTCQTQSGSAFGMAVRFPAESLEISSGRLKTFQRVAESGQVFTNAFCPERGTRIFHAAERSPGQISLKPGTLDDTAWLKPTHHVFTKSAQAWVPLPDDAKAFETMPADRGWLRGE